MFRNAIQSSEKKMLSSHPFASLGLTLSIYPEPVVKKLILSFVSPYASETGFTTTLRKKKEIGFENDNGNQQQRGGGNKNRVFRVHLILGRVLLVGVRGRTFLEAEKKSQNRLFYFAS